MSHRGLRSKTTPEVAASSVNDAVSKLDRMARGVNLPERTPSGRETKGADGFAPFSVTFPASRKDVFVGHDMDMTAGSWVLTGVRGFASPGARADGHITISDGLQSPTTSGFYLRAEFESPIAFVEARGFVYTRNAR